MDWEATGVGCLGPRSGRSRASVPSGASTGATEAKELRDGGARFKGAGCVQAVANAEGALAEAVVGLDPRDQAAVDAALCAAAPGDKAGLGANAVCALSMACCKAGAAADELPLFRHVNRLAAKVLGAPVPMCMPVSTCGRRAGRSGGLTDYKSGALPERGERRRPRIQSVGVPGVLP